jgi:hypothetical protein
MQKDVLKCKLEQIASSMGYEVRKKIDEELSPIHRLFNILIIFGFLTVLVKTVKKPKIIRILKSL